MGFLHAQQNLSEPYSRFGWGEIQSRSSSSVKGMGTTGYAFGDAVSVNTLNPASYTHFDSLSSIIDAAFSFRSHTLREEGRRQSGSTAYMEYLYIGLPVTSRWATVFGIQPFSMVNYNYSMQDALCTRQDIGNGGTYEVFWGNAFDITSFLSVGLQASYLFGTTSRLHDLVFTDDSYVNSRSENEYSTSGLLLNAGLQIEIPLGAKKLGLGLTYTPSIPALISVKQSNFHMSYQVSGSSDNILDTLAWSAEEKSVTRNSLTNPTTLGAGLSLSKKGHYWTGLDFTWTDWSNFSMGDNSDQLGDSYRISCGARWIPKSNSSRYLQKITIIGGAFYEKDYVLQHGVSLFRDGLDVGLSFPMRKSKTQISFYAEMGEYRLPDKSDGISEQYVTFTLQVQLHERWYQRRKLD